MAIKNAFPITEGNKYLLDLFPDVIRKFRLVIVPQKWRCTPFISFFSKSPPDIVCPSFWELKWAIGCPFKCDYCYLQGTFHGNKAPRIKDLEKLKLQLKEFLEWATSEKLRVILNTGELTDSLAVIKWTRELLPILIDTIGIYEGYHKVLFVTKGGKAHVKPLLEKSGELIDFSVVSFSLNARKVAQLYEHGTSSPDDRLAAAKACQDIGFEVRIRLDPIIPIERWKEAYLELMHLMIVEYGLIPARITIGTLRGLYKTIKYAENKAWIAFLKNGERTGWGQKMKYEERAKIYKYIIEKLKEYGYKNPIAICKETLMMWKELDCFLGKPGHFPLWENVNCNCVY